MWSVFALKNVFYIFSFRGIFHSKTRLFSSFFSSSFVFLITLISFFSFFCSFFSQSFPSSFHGVDGDHHYWVSSAWNEGRKKRRQTKKSLNLFFLFTLDFPSYQCITTFRVSLSTLDYSASTFPSSSSRLNFSWIMNRHHLFHVKLKIHLIFHFSSIAIFCLFYHL